MREDICIRRYMKDSVLGLVTAFALAFVVGGSSRASGF